MTSLIARNAYWSGKRTVIAISAAIAMFTIIATSAAAETITVLLDQAKVMRLPPNVTTVVVGNPLIADISVQSGGMIVITGKGYGVTNLIALDNRGSMVLQESIEVQGPSERIVIVYRGVERESYSCTPKCERRVMLGDTQTYFDLTLAQSGRRDSQAQTSGANPQGSNR